VVVVVVVRIVLAVAAAFFGSASCRGPPFFIKVADSVFGDPFFLFWLFSVFGVRVPLVLHLEVVVSTLVLGAAAAAAAAVTAATAASPTLLNVAVARSIEEVNAGSENMEGLKGRLDGHSHGGRGVVMSSVSSVVSDCSI
jgi:hypothetical protein